MVVAKTVWKISYTKSSAGCKRIVTPGLRRVAGPGLRPGPRQGPKGPWTPAGHGIALGGDAGHKSPCRASRARVMGRQKILCHAPCLSGRSTAKPDDLASSISSTGRHIGVKTILDSCRPGNDIYGVGTRLGVSILTAQAPKVDVFSRTGRLCYIWTWPSGTSALLTGWRCAICPEADFLARHGCQASPESGQDVLAGEKRAQPGSFTGATGLPASGGVSPCGWGLQWRGRGRPWTWGR